MKVLSGGSRVDTDLVDLRRVVAEILDVTEDVAFTVLAERPADKRTDGEVDGGRLFNRPLCDGQAADEDEALLVDDQLSDVAQERADFGGEGECFLYVSIFSRSVRVTMNSPW